MGTMSRREFVTQAGRYGGGAATSAMLALGLLAKKSAAGRRAPPPSPGSAPNHGRRVVILGAGLCGMAAAHELGKLGYTCEILEARARSGGRCWTVRGGTRETEVGGPEQIAGFPEGFYMNAGPARIPGHHTTTLGYCKEFGVPVEVFNNVNESAYYQVKNVGRVRLREARADLRGYVDELLAKAVNRDALDRPLTADDKDVARGVPARRRRPEPRPRLQAIQRPRARRSTARPRAAATSTTTYPPPGHTTANSPIRWTSRPS